MKSTNVMINSIYLSLFIISCCLLAAQWTAERKKNIKIIINGHSQILTIDDLNSFNNIMMKKNLKEIGKQNLSSK